MIEGFKWHRGDNITFMYDGKALPMRLLASFTIDIEIQTLQLVPSMASLWDWVCDTLSGTAPVLSDFVADHGVPKEQQVFRVEWGERHARNFVITQPIMLLCYNVELPPPPTKDQVRKMLQDQASGRFGYLRGSIGGLHAGLR